MPAPGAGRAGRPAAQSRSHCWWKVASSPGPAHRPWEGLSWFLQRAPCPQDALCYLTAELRRGPGARDAAIWRGVSLSSSMGLPQRLPPAEGQATAGLLLTTERCLTTTDHWLEGQPESPGEPSAARGQEGAATAIPPSDRGKTPGGSAGPTAGSSQSSPGRVEREARSNDFWLNTAHSVKTLDSVVFL